VRCKVVKNKVAAPFRQAEFDIIFTGPKVGISREGDIVDLGTNLEIVKKLGSFFSYGDLRLGQGRENAKAYLRENPELAQEIEDEIRKASAVGPVAAATPTVPDEDEEPE
jgi:recombination protein RecA